MTTPAVTPQVQTPDIDLSSGMVDQSPDIDLSAGMVAGPSALQPGQMTATRQPTTMIGKLGRWVENLSDDLKYGTDQTGIGTVLKAMGAHGLDNGNSQAVGEFMASLPLGILKATKGATQLAPVRNRRA